jgi:hypothetical protein
MPVEDSLIGLLACPRCDAGLVSSDGHYCCRACKIDFPFVGELPWLFADPDAAIGEWRGRGHFSMQQLAHESQKLKSELDDNSLRDLTRQRLDAQLSANEAHREALQEILSPLGLQAMQAPYESYLALRTRLPVDQGLNTYYANVHRDWAWGDEENDASLRQIENVLDGNHQLGDTLVLGAGACRLPYDLHMRLDTARTVAVDFNPLLLLVAQEILQGNPIEMIEFPLAPRSLDDFAVPRHLHAPEPVRDGLFLACADVLRAPFAKNSFDTIVTPWLIDILSEDLTVFAARINQLLKPGGRWINFGSLFFDHPTRAQRYGPEETLEIVRENGFDAVTVSESTIPYMCSPASRHGRNEKTFTFCAAKSGEVKAPPRHKSLPDWIVTGDGPVPLLSSFQSQTMSTRVYAFIMSLIDGKRSIKDMASILEQQKLMTRAEAEPAIRNFLIRMHDDARKNSSF